MNEEELNIILENCKRNDRVSQEKLYRYYYTDMFRLCQRYMSDPHISLSILNDSFLKVFQNIDKYKVALGNFKSWLKAIMINTAIDYTRKYKNEVRIVDIDLVQEKGEDDFTICHHMKYEELKHHMVHLPTVTRVVLNLFAFEGFSHKEIAQQLNISETTSRWHLSEARKMLRRSLYLNDPKLVQHG